MRRTDRICTQVHTVGVRGEGDVDAIVDHHPRWCARHGLDCRSDEPGQLPVAQTRFTDVDDVDAGRRSATNETEQTLCARRDDPVPVGDEADQRA